MIRWIKLFAVALALLPLLALGQRQHIRFARLGTDQGLSQSNAGCMLQDSRGFMWIGTRDGLNRYDGYRFTVFRHQDGDSTSLTNSYVTSIVEDRHGDLWVGTWGGGLCRYNRQKKSFTHYTLHTGNGAAHAGNPGTVGEDFINVLALDETGRLWIGTDGGGLNILDLATGKTQNIFSTNNSGPGDNDITAICEDYQHFFWIGTFKAGVSRYDPASGHFDRYMQRNGDTTSLTYNAISRIFEDRKQKLWIGTRGGGMDLLNRATGTFRHYRYEPKNPNSIGHDEVFSIEEDDSGHLWIGTENGGLSVMDPVTNHIDRYVQDDIDNTSLGNNSIDCIYRDREGNMWLGTYASGLSIFNKSANQFTTFRHNGQPASLSNNNVLYFAQDADRSIWIGTDGGGLGRMDVATGKITTYRYSPTNPNSPGGDYVLSIHEDRTRRLWIGTWGDGVTALDPSRKKFTRFRNKPGDTTSLGGNNIYSIVEDTDGDLWLGAYGNCLDRYDAKTGTFRHYRPEVGNSNSLASSRIHTMLADDSGMLWIGTFDGGLDKFDKHTGRFTHYIHSADSTSLSNNSINCIYEDEGHVLWIGTSLGLDRIDRAKGVFKTWTVASGLPSNLVYGVVGDGRGKLWITTSHGLAQFDPASGHIRNFSMADGLQSNEFKPHAYLRSSAGLIYVGGVNGFNEFDPARIDSDRTQSPLLFTGFQIFNKDVSRSNDSSLTLSYLNSVISFEFAYLDYAAPENNQYEYKLDGFDTGWNNIGTRRMVTFTNLDPGDYTLLVRARNTHGGWTTHPASLAITITPPFWKTWWFRALLLLAVAGIALAAHWGRTRALKRQTKLLELKVSQLLERAVAQNRYELASDILHDIGNAIVGFGTYVTRLKKMTEISWTTKIAGLAQLFRQHQQEMAGALGPVKAGAVIDMLEGIDRVERERHQEFRHTVEEQAALTARIQDILEIQRRYVSGQETQDRKPVDLRRVITDAAAMLQSTFQKNDIEFHLEESPANVVVKGDRTRLIQLMLNLLKNSADALAAANPRAPGSDTTKAPAPRSIVVALHQNDQAVGIRIKDTGAGFDEDTATSLATREGFSTKATGGGVGLLQCHAIAESHGGKLTLYSAGPGLGCLATVELNVS